MTLHCSKSIARYPILVLLAAALWLPAAALAKGSHKSPSGTWYLALDAASFGLPEGLSLPGLMTLHSDRTVLISDGGDFGGMPFNVRDSSQFGAWRFAGGNLKIVTLFLQADPIGDVRSWFRVQIKLRARNRNTMTGTVNVFQLPCNVPGAPFAVFSCPDPIESAEEFVPAEGPRDVPVTFRRLRPRFISRD